MHPNVPLTDVAKLVMGSPIIGALATTNGDCDYVSLKGYDRATIIILVDNAATVTGAAITLKQATAVAGTDEKALAFSSMRANVDCAAGDTLTDTAVTSNKNLMYVIEVAASDLDVANGFDCIRVDSLLMANAVGAVMYALHGARHASPQAISAIVD
jgi:hypothetical protein